MEPDETLKLNPMNISDYQNCETQEIPIHFLEGYQQQPASKNFKLKALFVVVFFVVLALPVIILFAMSYLIPKSGIQSRLPKNYKRYQYWQLHHG